MIGTALTLLPTALQAILGGVQLHQANKANKSLQDPTMPIPQSALDQLESAKTMASSFEMPGESGYLNNIGQVLGNANTQINRMASSSSQGLGALLNAVGTQQQALNDFGIAKAQNYNQNQQNLQSALGTMADWENMKWDNDVLQKFIRQSTANQAMAGAGIQNLFSGLSNASGVGANLSMLGGEKSAVGDEKSVVGGTDDAATRMGSAVFSENPSAKSIGSTTADQQALLKSVEELVSSGALKNIFK